MSIETDARVRVRARTVWPQSIPGATRSLENANSPLTFGMPSARGTTSPIRPTSTLRGRAWRVVTSRRRAGAAARRPGQRRFRDMAAWPRRRCAASPPGWGAAPPATRHHRGRRRAPAQAVLCDKSVTLHPQPPSSLTRHAGGHGSSGHPTPRGHPHRVEDLRVAGAAAEVARQRLADLVVASAPGCARAGRPPRRRAPACRSRTARRPPRRTPPARGAAGRRRRAPRPSTTSCPSACAASTRHAHTSTPSSSTEHDPHSPCSHAFFEPGTSSFSRSA